MASKIKHTAVQHKCKVCNSTDKVQRWSFGTDEINRTKYMCSLDAYKYNAFKLDRNGEIVEYARETYHTAYWNLPVGNRRVYCVYFVLVDGCEDAEGYDVFDINTVKSWEEIVSSELRSSDDTVVRVDVYDVPESLRGLYDSDLDLSQLGECMYSVTRDSIEE